jgi:hypothetical protein
MARKSTKGTKQVGAEVAGDLLEEFKQFCVARGDTLRQHLEMAMRRHLDNPPPVLAPPPLPPVTSPPPVSTAKKPKPKQKTARK